MAEEAQENGRTSPPSKGRYLSALTVHTPLLLARHSRGICLLTLERSHLLVSTVLTAQQEKLSWGSILIHIQGKGLILAPFVNTVHHIRPFWRHIFAGTQEKNPLLAYIVLTGLHKSLVWIPICSNTKWMEPLHKKRVTHEMQICRLLEN